MTKPSHSGPTFLRPDVEPIGDRQPPITTGDFDLLLRRLRIIHGEAGREDHYLKVNKKGQQNAAAN